DQSDAEAPQVVVVGGASSDSSPVTVLDNLEAADELPAVYFRDQPDSYTRGSGGVLRVGTGGPMPVGTDIIAIAWSDAESRIIDAFAHAVELDDLAIRGDRLDLLPPGETQIQLLVRRASQVHQIVRLNLDIVVPNPAPSALPGVGFVDAPSTYERGSGEPIRLEMDGAMPEGGDILVLAWSKSEQRMIEEFAFVVGDDLMIPAQSLDLLPAGGVQLQLLARLDNDVQRRVRHVLEVVEPVVPEPPAPMPLPGVGFDAPPTTYYHESGEDLAVLVSGPMPDDADIVVVAWSDSQQGMVSDFAFTMTNGDWTIPAARLDLLPYGMVNVQLLLRRDNEVHSVTAHPMEIALPAPVVTPEPEPAPRPAVAFGQTPSHYQIGSGQPIAIQTTGAFPDGTDLLVIAWSVDEARLVDDFAFTLTQGPFEIPASRMDLLPAGEVVLQLMPREDNTAYAQVVHRLTINAPILSGSIDGETEAVPDVEVVEGADGSTPDPDPQATPGETDVTDPDGQLADEGDAGEPMPGEDVEVEAPKSDPVNVFFAAGLSNTYLRGSGDSLGIVFSAPLPSDARVRMQAWSIDQAGYVSLFTQTLDEGPWEVPATQLELLEDGSYRIDIALLLPGQETAYVQHHLIINSPAAEATDGTIAATGFTTHSPAEDTKFVYVSAETGLDSNDGLTPQTPVRSIERGYALLRDGKPDWMLLRRGEVFELAEAGGDFRWWNRSGRSTDEPMLMGAYGPVSEARPIIHSNGDGIIRSLRANHVVFRDLHMRANRRDPQGPDYDPQLNNEVGVWIGSSQDILFEGCLIELFRINVSMLAYPEPSEPTIRNIRFHRCVIRDAYSHGETDSSGLFCKFVSGLKMTECVLDHNGWHEGVADSYRRGRNHNAYFSHCFDVQLIGNVIARGSYEDIKFRNEDGSMPSTGLRVEDNLFLACAYPMGFDTNNNQDNAPIVYRDVRVTGNVFVRTLGWPLNNPGGPMMRLGYVEDAVITGNVFCDPDPGNLRPRAIEINVDTELSNVVVAENTAALGFEQAVYAFPHGRVSTELLLANNPYEMPDHFYVDAERCMTHYFEGIEGVGSVDQFASRLGRQRLGAWDTALSCRQVVEYFSDGFQRVLFD
ncbi:MAG: hypothetical protein ACIAXF_06430, partial [Phycisphaerales bacterium JB063]